MVLKTQKTEQLLLNETNCQVYIWQVWLQCSYSYDFTLIFWLRDFFSTTKSNFVAIIWLDATNFHSFISTPRDNRLAHIHKTGDNAPSTKPPPSRGGGGGFRDPNPPQWLKCKKEKKRAPQTTCFRGRHFDMTPSPRPTIALYNKCPEAGPWTPLA